MKTNPTQFATMLPLVDLCTVPGFNPRSAVGDITELVASIREHGLLHPLTVCRAGDGGYHVVAGARRLAALTELGLIAVPCRVVDGLAIGDPQALAIALDENDRGRDELPPLDIAKAYRRMRDAIVDRLVDDPSDRHVCEEVGLMVGKSYKHVERHLALLDAPEAIRDRLARGEISKGAVGTLMAVPADVRQRVADRLSALPAGEATDAAVRRLAKDVEREDSVSDPVDASPEDEGSGERTHATPRRSRASLVLWRSKSEVRLMIEQFVGRIAEVGGDGTTGADQEHRALAALLWVTGAIDDADPGVEGYAEAVAQVRADIAAEADVDGVDNA